MNREFYMIVQSNDSLEYYPNNSPVDFRIHLKKSLNLKGNWMVSLTDIDYLITQENRPATRSFWVYLNVCQSTVVGDTSLPLLRRVPIVASSVDTDTQKEFLLEQFIPVIPNHETDLLHIYIYGDHHTAISLDFPVLCTLHFKQVSPPWVS